MYPSSGSEKAAFVRALFATIVRRYDLMNTLITFGQDRAWRRRVVKTAAIPPRGLALDAATGTGELALELVRQGAGLVVGVDFCPPMLGPALRKARRLKARQRLRWVISDVRRLPFRDDAFDGVVNGLLLRYLTDNIAAALAEMRRVVRPGGRVVCLELTPVPKGLFGHLFRAYFYCFVPLLGGLIAGQREAYRYLPHSLEDFPSAEELAGLMRQAGLREVSYELWARGTMAIHTGAK